MLALVLLATGIWLWRHLPLQNIVGALAVFLALTLAFELTWQTPGQAFFDAAFWPGLLLHARHWTRQLLKTIAPLRNGWWMVSGAAVLASAGRVLLGFLGVIAKPQTPVFFPLCCAIALAALVFSTPWFIDKKRFQI